MHIYYIAKTVNNTIFYFQQQNIINGYLNEKWTVNVVNAKSWKTYLGAVKFEQKLGYNADTFIYENKIGSQDLSIKNDLYICFIFARLEKVVKKEKIFDP